MRRLGVSLVCLGVITCTKTWDREPPPADRSPHCGCYIPAALG